MRHKCESTQSSRILLARFLGTPSITVNEMRSKYFAPASFMTSIIVSGCINNDIVLFHHTFISSHFTEALPYLCLPFLSDQFDMLKLP
jgi:hypothetical protein